MEIKLAKIHNLLSPPWLGMPDLHNRDIPGKLLKNIRWFSVYITERGVWV